MDNSIESIQYAVAEIMRFGKARGITITEEEMAGKIDMPPEQFNACINGRESIPDNFPKMLVSAYKDLIKWETPRLSLESMILHIKRMGQALGITITGEEMAGKLDISIDQLNAYLDGKERTPDNLSGELLTAYNYLLEALVRENTSGPIRSTIRLIKDHGVKAGMIIREEEMAERAGIPWEQFNAYVRGEEEAPDQVLSALKSAYPELLKNIRTGTVRLSSTKFARSPRFLLDELDDEE